MHTYDWLIVAPRHDNLESVDAEIASIAQHHNIVPQPPLVGYVTDLDVGHAVAVVDCSVICWSTHASGDGIELSDGHVLDADTAAQFVRVSTAELCIFNLCLGEKFAQRVSYLCACDVIYSPIEIGDREAAIYIGQYAAALAEHGDYHVAYEAVGSHGGDYKYIRASDSVTRGRIDSVTAIADLRSQNNQIKASVTQLGLTFILIVAMALWFGYVLSGMQTQLNRMQIQLGELRAEMRYLERTISDRRDNEFIPP